MKAKLMGRMLAPTLETRAQLFKGKIAESREESGAVRGGMVEGSDISGLAAGRTGWAQKDTSEAQRPWMWFQAMEEAERKRRAVEGQ